MVVLVYSTASSLSSTTVFSFQQSKQPPLHYLLFYLTFYHKQSYRNCIIFLSVSFITRNQELIPQNLTAMISVTLLFLSLAAVSTTQSSIVSLFLNGNFLELGPASSLVGSIAGSVGELMCSHGPP